MFDKIKEAVTEIKNTSVKFVNTPAPVGKTVLVAGIVIAGVFLATHKMKVVLFFG